VLGQRVSADARRRPGSREGNGPAVRSRDRARWRAPRQAVKKLARADAEAHGRSRRCAQRGTPLQLGADRSRCGRALQERPDGRVCGRRAALRPGRARASPRRGALSDHRCFWTAAPRGALAATSLHGPERRWHAALVDWLPVGALLCGALGGRGRSDLLDPAFSLHTDDGRIVAASDWRDAGWLSV